MQPVLQRKALSNANIPGFQSMRDSWQAASNFTSSEACYISSIQRNRNLSAPELITPSRQCLVPAKNASQLVKHLVDMCHNLGTRV
jgi:hypothetical protein